MQPLGQGRRIVTRFGGSPRHTTDADGATAHTGSIEENKEIHVYTYRKYNPAVETEEQWWDRTRRWKTAYHESGHAWIATRLGWQVRRVTLDPRVNGKLVGNGLTETYIPTLAPQAAVLMNYLAGKVCERLVLPRRLWGIWMMGGDMEDVSDAIGVTQLLPA